MPGISFPGEKDRDVIVKFFFNRYFSFVTAATVIFMAQLIYEILVYINAAVLFFCYGAGLYIKKRKGYLYKRNEDIHGVYSVGRGHGFYPGQ